MQISGELPQFPLTVAESALVAKARAHRRAEFAAGRACAKAAIHLAGRQCVELLSGRDREPLWPSDVTGSITHARGFCAAVVGDAARLIGLGLDVEVVGGVDSLIAADLMTADEQDQCMQLAESERPERLSMLFSAKEAFFKAQFPSTRAWIDFSDMKVEVVGEEFSIFPAGSRKVPPFSWPLTGWVFRREAFIFAGMSISRQEVFCTPRMFFA